MIIDINEQMYIFNRFLYIYKKFQFRPKIFFCYVILQHKVIQTKFILHCFCDYVISAKMRSVSRVHLPHRFDQSVRNDDRDVGTRDATHPLLVVAHLGSNVSTMCPESGVGLLLEIVQCSGHLRSNDNPTN